MVSGRVKSRPYHRKILDSWIRDRNLPVQGTIDSFIELIAVIGDVAKLMIEYGRSYAGGILLRSAEQLADTLHMPERENNVGQAPC